MKTPHVIIFDFDGVIVDSERIKFKHLRPFLKRKGLILLKNDFTQMVGKKTGVFLKERFGDVLANKQIKTLVEARRRDQLIHIKEYCKPIPGIKSFIHSLKKKGIRLCLATGTNRKIVQKALQLLGFSNMFDTIVTGEEFTSSKPDPEIYNLAIKKLSTPRKNISVIEDSAVGILAAKRAGLNCIAITTTQSRLDLKNADVIVHSFEELKKLFRI